MSKMRVQLMLQFVYVRYTIYKGPSIRRIGKTHVGLMYFIVVAASRTLLINMITNDLQRLRNKQKLAFLILT